MQTPDALDAVLTECTWVTQRIEDVRAGHVARASLINTLRLAVYALDDAATKLEMEVLNEARA